MIDSKSRVCYTKNILAELQKSEEDTMNYRSVKISEDARISKQSVLAGDVTIVLFCGDPWRRGSGCDWR